MRNDITSKQARLEARIAPETHALIKRAAEIQGRTLSDFVVSAAREAAMQAIERTEVVYLSQEDQIRFAEALINPPPLSEAMQRAITAHTRLVGAFE